MERTRKSQTVIVSALLLAFAGLCATVIVVTL